MKRLVFLNTHTRTVRKIFGAIILLAVAFIASGIDPQYLVRGNGGVTEAKAQNALQDALPQPYPAPEFIGVEAWLNSNPLTMQSLRGKVVLIDFWTYSCINCVRTLPHLTKWDSAYRDKGLVIIGIHSPEFEFEKNKTNVEVALVAHKIEYPVALDNKLDTWTAFQNRYWPAHYLIDQSGKVVYTHFGEGNYAETENNIRHLLGLDAKEDNELEDVTSSRNQSPETYLGYERATNFTSPEAVKPNEVQSFTAPKFIPVDHWALTGQWKVEGQRIVSEEAGASLRYNFTAGKVFLVLGTHDGKPIKAKIILNGEPLDTSAGKDSAGGILTVGKHTLYELVNQKEVKNGLLEIFAESSGFEAYAFTFGI